MHKRASGKNHDRSRSIARVVAVGIRSARDNRSLRTIKKDASVAIIGFARSTRADRIRWPVDSDRDGIILAQLSHLNRAHEPAAPLRFLLLDQSSLIHGPVTGPIVLASDLLAPVLFLASAKKPRAEQEQGSVRPRWKEASEREFTAGRRNRQQDATLF